MATDAYLSVTVASKGELTRPCRRYRENRDRLCNSQKKTWALSCDPTWYTQPTELSAINSSGHRYSPFGKAGNHRPEEKLAHGAATQHESTLQRSNPPNSRSHQLPSFRLPATSLGAGEPPKWSRSHIFTAWLQRALLTTRAKRHLPLRSPYHIPGRLYGPQLMCQFRRLVLTG